MQPEPNSQLPEEIDLVSPDSHANLDLTSTWQWLRKNRPVHWHPYENHGFWVVSRYQDIISVYRDNETFTSVNGNVLATLLSGGDSAGGQMLAVSDGPRHMQIRRALTDTLKPKALSYVTERIRSATRRLVANAVERSHCDFAADIAQHIPLAAICDLLRIPESDRNTLLSYTSSALSANTAGSSAIDAHLARNEILLYFSRLARERNDFPTDDLFGRLVQLTREPLALSEDELILNCYSLLLGGDETARLAMIGAVKALHDHPQQWQRLKSGEAAVEAAVEELLRWTTPALHSGRIATKNCGIASQQISAGDIVTVWMVSANFDQDEFEQPLQLDLARNPNRHLTFAFGPHFCLGAYLARVELAAVLEALIETTATIELLDKPRRIYSNFLSGFSNLNVNLISN